MAHTSCFRNIPLFEICKAVICHDLQTSVKCYTLISQNQETDNSVRQVADTPLSDYSEYLLPDYTGIYANI